MRLLLNVGLDILFLSPIPDWRYLFVHVVDLGVAGRAINRLDPHISEPLAQRIFKQIAPSPLPALVSPQGHD